MSRTETLIYAHRGANREAAENTRSAFERALEYPIDGMETDVQLTRDGIAVLWHDRFLGKLGLPDKRIDDFDYSQLRALNFAAHFSAHEHGKCAALNSEKLLAGHPDETCHARSPDATTSHSTGGTTSQSTKSPNNGDQVAGYKPASGQVAGYLSSSLPVGSPSPQSSPASGRGGERERLSSIPAGERDKVSLREFHVNAAHESIMSLQEFLDTYRERCRLLIEIKNRDWEERTRHEIKVRQTLDRIGATDGDALMASSFDLSSLIYAHQYRPGFPLVYNFGPEQTLADAQRVLVGYPFLHGLCLPIETLSTAMVTLLRSHGKSVAVYTCNSDAEIGKALELRVNILISDVPQKALQMRQTSF